LPGTPPHRVGGQTVERSILNGAEVNRRRRCFPLAFAVYPLLAEGDVSVQSLRVMRARSTGPAGLQLSPEAEITLRRIAIAIGGERLPAGSVRKLLRLRLIESFRGDWRLTPLGRNHHGSLTKALLHNAPPLADEIERILGMSGPRSNTKS
jgi:hypothetical protein